MTTSPPSSGTGDTTRPASGGNRPAGGSQGRRRAGARGGSGQGGSGASNQSRSGGSRSGQGGSRGDRSRSGSGNRRPSGQGGNRSGGGGGQGGGAGRTAEVVAPAPATRVDRTTDSAEEATATANRRKALSLCVVPGAALGALIGIALAAAGLPLVALVALVVVTAGVAAWVWRAAPGMVLGSLGAVPSTEDDDPRLHNLVDGLCATMGLDRPAIRVVASDVPNALALGRDQKSATLVVTSGLERSLGLVELEGVLAHELVHIKRNDTVLSAVAVVVAAPWSVLRGTVVGADTVHDLVGRGREFSADQRAALIVRYPTGIGAALEAMASAAPVPGGWPPVSGRIAALTRWLWFDPMAGAPAGESTEGNLDDTRVRASTLTELGGSRARMLG